MDFINL